MENELAHLSKTIDRLYQKQRESGLTKYVLLSSLILCSLFLADQSKKVIDGGSLSILYIYFWLGVILFIYGLTFYSHLNISNQYDNQYSKLKFEEISTWMRGVIFITSIISVFGLLMFRTTVDFPGVSENFVAVMSLFIGVTFLFVTLALIKILRKNIEFLYRDNKVADLFRMNTFLHEKSDLISQVRNLPWLLGFLLISGISYPLILGEMGIESDLFILSLSYSLAITGIIIMSFQFLIAQSITYQINQLQRLESIIYLNDTIEVEDKKNLIKEYLYIPDLNDWLSHNLDQFQAITKANVKRARKNDLSFIVFKKFSLPRIISTQNRMLALLNLMNEDMYTKVEEVKERIELLNEMTYDE